MPTAVPTRPRVLLADDHALLLDAFEKLLAPHYHVVGKIADSTTLIEAVEALRPDAVVLDIAMPGLNGVEAARLLKQRSADIRLVFLTVNEDTDLMNEAFRAGASAYVLKRSAASELTAAINEALNGRSYVTPLLSEGVVASLQLPKGTRTRPITPRQREILSLIVQGQSMKQIAAALSLTPKTVAFHKYRMMEQLGFKSTAELVVFATKHRIGC